jgi:catechol 2,3-dioxygenase-like lactoylglutathione lyase family enzyme
MRKKVGARPGFAQLYRTPPLPPAAMNPVLQLSDLGQIAVSVSDVAAAKKFYAEVLGLAPLFDAGPNLSFLAAGTVRLMLTSDGARENIGKASVLYFKTPAVADTYRILLERGARGEQAPRLVAKMPDHELWMAFVRDPDGNLVGLMEERR